MEINHKQQQVKEWFDKIYRTKGFSYLRAQPAYEIFTSLLEVKPGKKHLDIACGLGLMLKTMADRGLQCYGIDISDEAVTRAKKYCPEATIKVANAEKLPFPDNTFDYITCLGSLERMFNREKVIREQLRVAKTSARFCFMVRNSEHFIWRFFLRPFGLDNKKGHQDALNIQEWISLFESCGLTIDRITRDHWPYYKTLSILWPFTKIDTSRPLRFLFPVSWSYEFIFILKKS